MDKGRSGETMKLGAFFHPTGNHLLGVFGRRIHQADASIAPGQRAAACEVCVVGMRLLSIHFSGTMVSNVNTTLQ